MSALVKQSQIRLQVYTTPALLEEKRGASELAIDSCGVNQPVQRKDEILKALTDDAALQVEINMVPLPQSNSLGQARHVHDSKYIDFLESAWDRWSANPHRDPEFFANEGAHVVGDEVPAMVPGNGKSNDPSAVPGKSVTSQCTYYVTDVCAPIFATLVPALAADAAVVRAAIDAFPLVQGSPSGAYALVTHPGHHAARASAAGYCYVNQAAVIADALRRERAWVEKVAIIDVDYHCGNGTVGIFWDDPNVFVCSIHADPDIEYPYNCGFADQVGGTGNPAAIGATLCLPMQRGTRWSDVPLEDVDVDYKAALQKAVNAAKAFGAQALVVSLGVDTLARDPVAVPGAGFEVELEDYVNIGAALRQCGLPTVFVQEGGYDINRLGTAVSNTLRGFCSP